MNNYHIIFSPQAKKRLASIADYLYKQNLSKSFVKKYLTQFNLWLNNVLTQFPESGTPMPEFEKDFGKNICRVVYQEYSFVYRVKNNSIEILTIYRENLP